jgi:hypothetical protein
MAFTFTDRQSSGVVCRARRVIEERFEAEIGRNRYDVRRRSGWRRRPPFACWLRLFSR